MAMNTFKKSKIAITRKNPISMESMSIRGNNIRYNTADSLNLDQLLLTIHLKVCYVLSFYRKNIYPCAIFDRK